MLLIYDPGRPLDRARRNWSSSSLWRSFIDEGWSGTFWTKKIVCLKYGVRQWEWTIRTYEKVNMSFHQGAFVDFGSPSHMWEFQQGNSNWSTTSSLTWGWTCGLSPLLESEGGIPVQPQSLEGQGAKIWGVLGAGWGSTEGTRWIPPRGGAGWRVGLKIWWETQEERSCGERSRNLGQGWE